MGLPFQYACVLHHPWTGRDDRPEHLRRLAERDGLRVQVLERSGLVVLARPDGSLYRAALAAVARDDHGQPLTDALARARRDQAAADRKERELINAYRELLESCFVYGPEGGRPGRESALWAHVQAWCAVIRSRAEEDSLPVAVGLLQEDAVSAEHNYYRAAARLLRPDGSHYESLVEALAQADWGEKLLAARQRALARLEPWELDLLRRPLLEDLPYVALGD